MIRRTSIRITLLASMALALLVTPAAGATSTQIHQDAADGVIDGKYTLAELQNANRTVPAEQREYYGWDEAYAAAVRRLKNPKAPVVPVPVDSNKNGTIDPGEKRAAIVKADKVNQARGITPKTPATPTDDDSTTSTDDDDQAIAAANSDDDSGGDDEGGTSWLLALLLLVPLAIIGFGVLRMRRDKGSGKPTRPRGPSGGSTSSFTSPDGR